MCRVRKIKQSYNENLAADGAENQEEGQIIYEGIFDSCDANSTHIILLELVILRVYGPDPYDPNARSDLIRRAEKGSLNLQEVSEIRFPGINITQHGIKIIKPSQKQSPKLASPESKENQSQNSPALSKNSKNEPK